MKKAKPNISLLNQLAQRALYYSTQMIYLANHREGKVKGDPKVGGHPAACASSVHILTALHLHVRSGFDHIANKPHGAPMDHCFHYMLRLFLESDFSKFTDEKAKLAMLGLRAFAENNEPVFQSYHSAYDPDHHNYFPSGTVGIPPVNAGYLALAYRFAKEHGYEVPSDAHFWALIGDSEFREGSLFEAIPDFAERELGNLTWMVDYNRQSLDGHRITNKEIIGGNDNRRIARTMEANGWEVIDLQHGSFREQLFAKPDGEIFKKFLEADLEDYELQTFLLSQDMQHVRTKILEQQPALKKFVQSLSDVDLKKSLHDLGGHDIEKIIAAMEKSKLSQRKPTMIIIHTIKGWSLSDAAHQGNHSSLPDQAEMDALREKEKISANDLFQRFAENSTEGKFLKERGEVLYSEILTQNKLKEKNAAQFQKQFEKNQIPAALNINLKMVNYPHTQWMLGQLTAKLTRIANIENPIAEETGWKTSGELFTYMAPDVGTSTNLNPAMDGKIFGANETEDYETEFAVKDTKLPDLIPGEELSDRFIRFEIAEANVVSAVGSFGQMRDKLGIPILPLMTVYDFFVKRALDQFFYNLYWKSSFIIVGTPAGVTLSPEGAQHGWKSDFQIPNQITWEPTFCIELDWILSDAIKRHMLNDNAGRTGVHIRGVTRGLDQKILMKRLSRQARFKAALAPEMQLTLQDYAVAGGVDESTIANFDEEQILNQLHEDVLSGAYYLIDYRGYAGYEPGDNVVNIFSLGSLVTEAVQASDELLQRGIYANVIVVTSTDLLVGNLAHENNYQCLKERLAINNHLYLHPKANLHDMADLVTVAGRRIPIVSVHDGEPGLLDNIGSIIGVRHESLAVRKHSKCGRPDQIYRYHHIDSGSIVETCGQVLAETALEQVAVSRTALEGATESDQSNADLSKWQQLWPRKQQH